MSTIYPLIDCIHCGKEVPAGTFCVECGNKLQKKTGFRPTVTCSGCGKKVAEGNFCSACGEKLPTPSENPNELAILQALVEMDFFPYTPQEKVFLLYLLSKKPRETKSEFTCSAPIKDCFTIFEIYNNDYEELEKKVDSFMKHSPVYIDEPRCHGGFNWLSSVSANERRLSLSISKRTMPDLEKSYNEQMQSNKKK